MTIDDDTKVVEVNDEEGILQTVEILAGAALLGGNRRLYEHLYGAVLQHKAGVNLGWSLLIGKDKT